MNFGFAENPRRQRREAERQSIEKACSHFAPRSLVQCVRGKMIER
jgi:hypothetical protein